jgi:anti-sigma regulatory factor (Ser/Thr protein kinase)
MPALSRTAMFLARLDRLRPLREFLEGFCTEAALADDQRLRLNLVLEELFTNTVRHGHGGDSDAPVWVTLTRGPAGVNLTYEDTAPPFNPYGRPPDAPPDTTVKMRKIGGLGVLLTRKLATSREYAYLYGRNRIRLALSPQ